MTPPDTIAETIYQRIRIREEAALQLRFLQRLMMIPLGQYLQLVGSAALHGVYVRKRWSPTLDFVGSGIVSLRFREMLGDANLHVKNHPVPNSYVISGHGRALTRVSFTVRILPSNGRMNTSQVGSVRLFRKGHAVVNTMALPALLLAKWDLMQWKARPIDFLDFWWGLQTSPDLIENLLALLNEEGKRRQMSNKPKLVTKYMLNRLELLRDSWPVQSNHLRQDSPSVPVLQALPDEIANVPDFDTVYAGIGELVHAFKA